LDTSLSPGPTHKNAKNIAGIAVSENASRRCKSKVAKEKKKIEHLDLAGRFNALIKKAKEEHLKGLINVDLAVLQDPYLNSEDCLLDSGHVEDIANEMRPNNSYATVAILLAAIVASGTKIDKFNALWRTHQNNSVDLENAGVIKTLAC
jgi:hypothetical protein